MTDNYFNYFTEIEECYQRCRGTKTLLLQAFAAEKGGPAEIYALDLHPFKARLLEELRAHLGPHALVGGGQRGTGADRRVPRPVAAAPHHRQTRAVRGACGPPVPVS